MTITESDAETAQTVEVSLLKQRVAMARERLAYQHDPALTEALSESELRAERQLAERIREQRRDQRWKEVQAASSGADRARRTTEEIDKADLRDLLIARKAIAAQRRESSPHAKVASLYTHRKWSLRGLAVVVGAGMAWSAVNVQQNIAPTGPSDPLFWFSYLLEGMISLCLIIIMIGTSKVSEWGVLDSRKQIVAAELALLGLTVGLNTYPYIRLGNWYDVGVHAVAPVMIGVALLIHDAASDRYGKAIERATAQVQSLPDIADHLRHAATKPTRHQAAVEAVEPEITQAATADPTPAEPTTPDSEAEAVTMSADPEQNIHDDAPAAVDGGGVVPFVRRVKQDKTGTSTVTGASASPRARRWFGGDLTETDVEQLAQAVFDSRRTQQPVDVLAHMIRSANAGQAATAIARELGMKAHSTVVRALNVADELHRQAAA